MPIGTPLTILFIKIIRESFHSQNVMPVLAAEKNNVFADNMSNKETKCISNNIHQIEVFVHIVHCLDSSVQ